MMDRATVDKRAGALLEWWDGERAGERLTFNEVREWVLASKLAEALPDAAQLATTMLSRLERTRKATVHRMHAGCCFSSCMFERRGQP